VTGQGRTGLGPESPIPDKLYFKIGEVADLVGVQTHVLRYWEKEIPSVRPTKSSSNQRRYRRKDVEIFREIRRLLYQERFTLAGARKRIAGGRGHGSGDPGDVEVAAAASADPAPAAAPATDPATSERLKEGLRDLIRLAGEEP